METEFRSKETSWLSFNARVLQEAADPRVPLYDRIKFLGIYSSNLDEFFRVRVATLRRLVSLGDEWKRLDIPDPNQTLKKVRELPMYLAVRASKSSGTGRPMHALIEIPQNLPRFIPLPKKGDVQLVMYLDDIIRFGLDEVFATFPYDRYESYAIKFTRDSELEFDDDFTESFTTKLEDSLKAREEGLPVRANFDRNFPKHFLNLVLGKLDLASADTLYPGARYHNRRDLLTFPDFGIPGLKAERATPVPVKAFSKRAGGMFAAIRKRDVLVHIPYQSFRHLITLLQEASVDPLVQSISATQYRLAKDSSIAKALQAAARNGKRVFVLVEPQARFDEEANIKWAGRYRDAGVQVQLGVQGLKVHSKMIHIVRREQGRDRSYTVLGTGNFNEDSATVFADHLLFTFDQEIGDDAGEIFRFFRQSYLEPRLKHIKIAPYDLRDFLRERVEREIANHQAGLPAGISIKVNNFSDRSVNALFHRAAEAGVPVRLIVRSMYSLVVEDGGPIEAISIVDRYLEHSRILIFENGGDPDVHLSSADFMPRNFDTRVETIFPVRDPRLRQQLIDYFQIQWNDNTKARILDRELVNGYRKAKKSAKRVRAQYDLEDYLRQQNRA